MLFLSKLIDLESCSADAFRFVRSKLQDRLWPVVMLAGIEGTGGAFEEGEVVPFALPGEGDLKVRSVIDP